VVKGLGLPCDGPGKGSCGTRRTSQTLFCPGMPGAAKTSFTSLVIRHLEDRFRDDPGVAVTYIYVNYHGSQEQEPVSLLASLLKQLIHGS
jgi:hypothetical protein